MERPATVVVVGAGGNIGSHLVPHLARMPEIGRLVLVDRDVYEDRNRLNQEVPPSWSRRGKAAAQAYRARRLNPTLELSPVREDVETVPLGMLRGDLIMACLDSRRARQAVNQAAWRLGVPWIDAGVLSDGMLARVTRYVPGAEAPCLECGWDDADYAAVEQRYPCMNGNGAPPPTAAPSSLGALAAALQAIECRKQLTGGGAPLPPGSAVMLDADHHRHFVTATLRNPRCRLSDHEPWILEPFCGPGQTLRTLLERGRERMGGSAPVTLCVDGLRFVASLRCGQCAAERRALRLAGHLRRSDRRCSACGAAVAVSGFALIERLSWGELTPRELDRPLSAFGLRIGDVVTVGMDEREMHCELVAR